MKNQKGNISVIVSFVIVVGIIGLIVYALLHTPKIKENPLEGINTGAVSDSTTTPEPKTLPQFPAENPSTSKKSMERVSKNGDMLSMNYTGHLTDGTVFDSNVDPKFGHVKPFEFKLGAGQVIAGWDEGLVGMKVGDKKTLTITPDKGYGSRAVGSIPANSTLVFDVEVLDIK